MKEYRLFHYYDIETGPFRNLSQLPAEDAQAVSDRLRSEGRTFAGRRSTDYMLVRRELEARARELFIQKGGRPRNAYPHYLTLGACEWLETWYEKPGFVEVPWGEIAEESISFTYGDLFPTMRYRDDKPYRRQVYTKQEIVTVIERFGWPQAWNKQGEHGPERYIEAQVWDERAIHRFLNATTRK